MADYETIMRALRNADAAGDVEAATRLAAMARAAQQAPAPAPAPVEAAPPAPRGMGQRIYDNVIGDPTDGVQSWGEGLGTWLGRAGESATLGVVGDEASAAMTSMLPGRSYDGELERYRANEEGMSGLGKLSADLAGAVVPGVGLGATALRAGTRGAAALRAGGLGSAAGATYGFAEGEGGDDRLQDGVIGGAIGGGIGMATPALSSLARNAWARGKGAVASRSAISGLAGQIGTSKRGAQLAADVVGMDDQARMRAAMSGPDTMLADAGPTVQGALDAVIQSPGEGARTALSRIEARATRAGDRLRTTLDSTLTGNSVGGASTRQFDDAKRLQGDIRSASAPARRAVYDRAYSQPIDYSAPDGAALIDRVMPRLPADAVSYANRLMRLNGEKSAQIMARIGDDGAVTFTNPPDVRQWDYIKQALDGLAESGDGAGALGGQTRMGSAYQSLAREIRGSLGRAVPEYDEAVNVAGDVIGQVKAIKTGETLLRAGVTRAEAEAQLAGMSAAEKAAVKRGLRQSIEDTLSSVRAVATDPNIDARQVYKAYTDLSSQAARDKMRLLLGDDWGKLEGALDQAAGALGMRARVATNSRTFGRQQFGEMIDESVDPGRIRSGEFIGLQAAPRQVWQNVVGSTPAAVQKAKGRVRNELADVLTRPDGAWILQQIEQARASSILPATTGRALQQLMMMGLIGNTGQLSSRMNPTQ